MAIDPLPTIPETWRESEVRELARQGMSRAEIVERGFAKSAVYAILRGWAMNARVRKLRAKAHASMGPS